MKIRDAYSYDDLLLVPQHGILNSRKDADISTELVPGFPLLVPIVSANMPSVTEHNMAFFMYSAGAHGVLHRFCTIAEQIGMFKKTHGAGSISIGIKDGMERTEELASEGAKLFFLDVAHADTNPVMDFIAEWRDKFFSLGLVAGNVATLEAATRIAALGVDGIKIGIGPGAACTTREVTGFGVPQLTAVFDCSRVKDYYDVTIIADGGIKNSGDIVKALAAGADTVMIGKLLAGCDEAPHPGEYFGNASHRMNGHNAPEGISGAIDRTGPVVEVIKKLAWGIRSGISYAGAKNLQELRENAEWVRVTPQSLQESRTRI